MVVSRHGMLVHPEPLFPPFHLLDALANGFRNIGRTITHENVDFDLDGGFTIRLSGTKDPLISRDAFVEHGFEEEARRSRAFDDIYASTCLDDIGLAFLKATRVLKEGLESGAYSRARYCLTGTGVILRKVCHSAMRMFDMERRCSVGYASDTICIPSERGLRVCFIRIIKKLHGQGLL